MEKHITVIFICLNGLSNPKQLANPTRDRFLGPHWYTIFEPCQAMKINGPTKSGWTGENLIYTTAVIRNNTLWIIDVNYYIQHEMTWSIYLFWAIASILNEIVVWPRVLLMFKLEFWSLIFMGHWDQTNQSWWLLVIVVVSTKYSNYLHLPLLSTIIITTRY